MERQVNAATVALMKQFEGLYLEAYKCPAGVWTIGWGHTGLVHKDGSVYPGLKISQERAEELLQHDLRVFCAGVIKLLYPEALARMNDNMFGALVSFAHNVGTGNFADSTLRSRVNARRWIDCIPEFAKWNRANGSVLRGLTRRRAAEAALFCSFPA